MTLFLQNDQDKKILTIISSQMINLIKMNNKIIDIILNKCNIYDSFLSIINSVLPKFSFILCKLDVIGIGITSLEMLQFKTI